MHTQPGKSRGQLFVRAFAPAIVRHAFECSLSATSPPVSRRSLRSNEGITTRDSIVSLKIKLQASGAPKPKSGNHKTHLATKIESYLKDLKSSSRTTKYERRERFLIQPNRKALCMHAERR